MTRRYPGYPGDAGVFFIILAGMFGLAMLLMVAIAFPIVGVAMTGLALGYVGYRSAAPRARLSRISVRPVSAKERGRRYGARVVDVRRAEWLHIDPGGDIVDLTGQYRRMSSGRAGGHLILGPGASYTPAGESLKSNMERTIEEPPDVTWIVAPYIADLEVELAREEHRQGRHGRVRPSGCPDCQVERKGLAARRGAIRRSLYPDPDPPKHP